MTLAREDKLIQTHKMIISSMSLLSEISRNWIQVQIHSYILWDSNLKNLVICLFLFIRVKFISLPNLCNKRYTTFAALNIRHASIHEGVTSPCDSCNYKPATRGPLSRHVKAVHDGIRLPCDQCNKSNNDGTALTRHQERIHDGILQPYEMCSKLFGEKYRLKKHIASFHRE